MCYAPFPVKNVKQQEKKKAEWIDNHRQNYLYGPGGGVSERADSVALDGPGDLFQHGDLALVCLALFHLDEHLLKPSGALSSETGNNIERNIGVPSRERNRKIEGVGSSRCEKGRDREI